MQDRMGGMAPRSPAAAHPDSFGARSTLAVNGRDYEIFSLKAPALTQEHDVSRLPYSIKVILENLLRHEDSPHVSADDIAVAVTPFGQVDNRLARRYDGTGLGLPLTKALVDLHGGTLSIDSEPLVGTIVRVNFTRVLLKAGQEPAAVAS